MTQKDISAKLLRQALGLPETATDDAVRAACKGHSHEDICDAVNCHCVQMLAEGAPGLTDDVPLVVILTPEVLKARASNPGAPLKVADPNCCGLDGYCSDGPARVADLITGKDKPAGQCGGSKKSR